MISGKFPQLESLGENRSYQATGRVLTLGASSGCTVRLEGSEAPNRACHILFAGGSHTLQSLDPKMFITVNGEALKGAHPLSHGDCISIGESDFRWLERAEEPGVADRDDGANGAVGALIQVVTSLLRNRDQDVFGDLVASVSHLLGSDAARIVGEDPEKGGRWTIARYPSGADLGRFSARAIDWAKSASKTVIMHDDDWRGGAESMASLERNRVASVLCAPLFASGRIVGYLYLDRLRERHGFTEEDRSFCDSLAPLFAEILANADERRRQRDTIARLQNTTAADDSGMIYESSVMIALISRAGTFAAADSPVLILGETGTGKELTARFIHDHSTRRDGPFRPINCGAIPENLIESELFGHEKGAFTGADRRKIGLLESADGGTVFLDEVGELPLLLQVKLLRTLQEGEIVRVGGTEPVRINLRIVAATNRNLGEEVKEGRFRQDLYFRLNVLALHLPPLRERGSDLVLVAEAFVHRYCARFGLNEKTLTAGARSALMVHSWPGNIRELENVIQKAVLLSSADRISAEDIALDNSGAAELPADAAPITLKEARIRAEKGIIERTLEKVRGNVSLTSKILDIDRKWLMKKMDELEIAPDRYRP